MRTAEDRIRIRSHARAQGLDEARDPVEVKEQGENKMKPRISKITGKPVRKRNYKTKTGRPTKATKEIKKQIERLAQKGFIDAEMAQFFDITQQTLDNWKKADPKFFGSIKKAKELPDAEVVQALFDRAKGYRYLDEDGNEKRYPPDPVSMIFWLKNRQPKKWRDNKSLEHTGKDGKDLTIQIMKFSDSDEKTEA